MPSAMPRVVAATFLILASSVAMADIGVNVKGGTLGAGVELSAGFGERFSVNLGANAYNYKTSGTQSNIDYDEKLDLKTGSLLANFHPFAGVFRFTFGAMYNRNELELTSNLRPGSSYSVGNNTYTAFPGDSLTGKLTFNKTAPYVGIGWGNRPGSHFGLTADVGALYQGSPKVSLTGSGQFANPALAADLAAEQRQLEDDLKNFKWYPVVALGLYFRF